MPKGSKELENQRREEIVDACERLYAVRSFKDITIKDIGGETSFTRTSIYNYFVNKEEIFLALFAREYMRWGDALQEAAERGGSGAEEFADVVAASLAERPFMLKLLAMNMYDMEDSSRQERLVEFKRAYARTLDNMRACYAAFFPADDGAESFILSFYPFLFGVYPYTSVTEKQRSAMDAVGMTYALPSVYELARETILKLLGKWRRRIWQRKFWWHIFRARGRPGASRKSSRPRRAPTFTKSDPHAHTPVRTWIGQTD